MVRHATAVPEGVCCFREGSLFRWAGKQRLFPLASSLAPFQARWGDALPLSVTWQDVRGGQPKRGRGEEDSQDWGLEARTASEVARGEGGC